MPAPHPKPAPIVRPEETFFLLSIPRPDPSLYEDEQNPRFPDALAAHRHHLGEVLEILRRRDNSAVVMLYDPSSAGAESKGLFGPTDIPPKEPDIADYFEKFRVEREKRMYLDIRVAHTREAATLESEMRQKLGQ